jgi:hypothetical protein
VICQGFLKRNGIIVLRLDSGMIEVDRYDTINEAVSEVAFILAAMNKI